MVGYTEVMARKTTNRKGLGSYGFGRDVGDRDSRVLGPIETTFILSAAVQGGILGWGNGFNTGFSGCNAKIGVCGVLAGIEGNSCFVVNLLWKIALPFSNS
jgi:hypothetical protein